MHSPRSDGTQYRTVRPARTPTDWLALLLAVAISVGFLWFAFGCGAALPPVVVPPLPIIPAVDFDVVVTGPGGPIEGASVDLNLSLNPDRFSPPQLTNAGGWTKFEHVTTPQTFIRVSADGYESQALPVELDIAHARNGHVDVTLISTRKGRRGLVRLDGRTFIDDDGHYLAVGTSLFWGLWGYQHDRPRLEAHLDWLARHGVDYIRVFTVIGPRWASRTIDPRDPHWAADLAGLLDLVYAHGLRTEITVWQDTDLTPTAEDRVRLLDRLAVILAPREATVQYLEIANEGDADLSRWPAGWPDEAQTLATKLRAETPHVVAVTSPGGVDSAEIARWYGHSSANLLTPHLPREVVGAGDIGLWRYVRQTWDPWLASPLAWTNDEGKGPQSSVADDDDPLRLTMYAGLTWLCGGAGFVLHTGAGVSGDGERGRPLNVYDTPHIEEILSGITAIRQLLPPDLPNWTRHNSNPNFPGYPFEIGPIQGAIGAGQLLRAFAATSPDGRVIAMPIVAAGPVSFAPRRGLHLTVHNPLTGQVTQTADGPFELAPAEAAVLVGTPR